MDEAAFRGEVPIGPLIGDALARAACAHQLALVTESERLTYDDLRQRVSRLAGAMIADGIATGDAVGLLGHRDAATVALFLAALTVGAKAVVLDPRQPEETIREQLALCGVTRPVLTEATLQHTAAPVRMPEPAATDAAMIQLTSGSTGRPKGVVLSHGNLTCNAAGVLARTGLTPDDRLLHVMPLHHTNGINNQVIAPLLAGATIVLHARFRAAQAVDALERDSITIMTGVPTIFARMLPLVAGRRFASLRFLRCGSAPLNDQLHRDIEAAFRVPLILSYGLSEATCTSAMNVPETRCIGSVGRVLRGQRIGIFRPHCEDEMSDGGEGEIRIAGPSLMQGYLGSDEAPVEGGWLRTGDLGTLDADGNLKITGRLKELIIRGGENISPGQIERTALELPEIASCCAIGAPDGDLGEVPVLFVTSTSGAIDGERVRAHIRERLSRAHEPSRVVELAALPENSVGKVDRKALAARLASH